MKILLVDDSRTIRNMQKSTLAMMGFTDILEASDGVEALAILTEVRPDLVLVDWNMPNMDGITLIRKVRETDTKLPIVMVAPEEEKISIMEAFRAGVSDCVAKPFTAETLTESIDGTLSKLGVAANA